MVAVVAFVVVAMRLVMASGAGMAVVLKENCPDVVVDPEAFVDVMMP